MRRVLVAVLALATLPTIAQTPASRLLEGEELTLTSSQPSHLAGTFKHGQTSVKFDSRANGADRSFELRDSSGKHVFSVTSNGESYTEQFYGESFGVTGTITVDTTDVDAVPQRRGEVRSLSRFVASPEYETLPFLSRALGVNHFRGDNAPAALYVHGLGLASATTRSITLPVTPLNEGDDRHAWSCKDVRDDPCGNTCFGLCGRGCSVWWWVCGDPCQHKGCFNHDIACRLCDCDRGHCIGCYTATTFLTVAPCKVIEGCKTPPC
jgi:hypothetical protein